MKKFVFILLIWVCNGVFAQNMQKLLDTDTVFAYNNPANLQKHFFKSSLEVTGINVFVNLFDRFVLDADFAKISYSSVKHNIEYGFVWDNDKFATNLFFHPYHGNLYFNAARSNNLSFIQSAPYAFFGSLMWETCGETEPPAVNDLIATTMGGICLGEITHRLSDLILDDSQTGWNRFFRELLCTAISPMKGFNRIISGKAMKVSNKYYKYHDFETLPVQLSLTFGDRYLCDRAHFTKGENNTFVDAGVVYGDVFNETENKPYDYFTANITAGLSGNQPLITHVSMLGRLWGVNIQTGTPLKMQFGLFQNFNYYNSEAVFEGLQDIPYRISEAASVGTGLIYEFPKAGNINKLSQRIFFNTVLLGGSVSDYYNYIDRDYNMGSGFSARLNTYIEFAKYGAFTLNAEYYRIFTWKGYEKKDYQTINPLYLNSQGDKSVASLLVINPVVEFFITECWDLELSAYYFLRNTKYDYFQDVESRTFELRIGMNYHFALRRL